MLARFRRFRVLTWFLLALSPPVAGTVLPVLAPCPVDAPWLATQAGGTHNGHGDHDPTPGPGQDGRQCCHCIGACHAGPAPEWLPALSGPSYQARGAERSPEVPTFRPLGSGRLRYLLPPATAPPTA